MTPRQPAFCGKVPNPAVVYRKMRMQAYYDAPPESGASFSSSKRKERKYHHGKKTVYL
jgi:hypothetical protein